MYTLPFSSSRISNLYIAPVASPSTAPMSTTSLAQMIAAQAIHWPEDKLEEMECCRETMRRLCEIVGHTAETAPLATVWVNLTKAKIQMSSSFDGSDITRDGMGPIKENTMEVKKTVFESLNFYQKVMLQKEIKISFKVLLALDCWREQPLVDTMTFLETSFVYLGALTSEVSYI